MDNPMTRKPSALALAVMLPFYVFARDSGNDQMKAESITLQEGDGDVGEKQDKVMDVAGILSGLNHFRCKSPFLVAAATPLTCRNHRIETGQNFAIADA